MPAKKVSTKTKIMRRRRASSPDLIKVTPFKQTDSSRCGPAVVKMILDFNGEKATEDELCAECNHTFDLGCTNEGMRKALECYGLKVTVKEDASLSDIRKYIDKGIPVMVDWFTSGVDATMSTVPGGHASIVVGMDDKKIYLLDPENAKVRPLLHNDFMQVWFDWKKSNTIQKWSNMVLRHMMVAEK